MKKSLIAALISLLIYSCGVNKQVDKLKALQNCKYQLISADSVFLANMDVNKIIKERSFNLSNAPNLAFAFLQQSVPLKANLIIQIKNPGKSVAGISGFEYKVMIKNQELISGIVNQNITIEPNGTVNVPLRINKNIYSLLADSENRKAVTDFLKDDMEKKAIITLKLKPDLLVGGKKIQYPGFISMDKEISNKKLFSYLEDIK